jgi:hypothetical protein
MFFTPVLNQGNWHAVAVGVARQVEIFVNNAFKLVPTAAAPTTITKEIRATNKPYSMAVAPRCLLAEALGVLFIIFIVVFQVNVQNRTREDIEFRRW